MGSWSRMRYFLIPIWRAKKRREREKKKKKKKKRKKAKKGMDKYGLLWICRDFWTFYGY